MVDCEGGTVRANVCVSTNLCNAADVLIPILFRKSEVFIQAEAHIVAVKPIGRQPDV